MNNLFLYLAPPLIGAIIGYVTNAIAIKMLFRPLYPVKIWKFQLPFTPGILPRERYKLADNIGQMVERELLTEEIIRQRLAKPDLVQTVEQGVSTTIKRILDTKFNGESELAREVIKVLVQIIHNPRFLDSIESILDKLLENLQHRSPTDLSGKKIEELQNLLEPFVLQKLEQILPGVANGLGTLLDAHYGELKDRLISFLRLPEIHYQLEIQGRIFLKKTLQKLNAFQRFFISAAQYDRTLDERMGDIIDDLITQIDALLSNDENRASLVHYTQHLITDLGQQRETLYRLSGMIYGLIVPMLHRELGDLLQSITGMDREQQRKVLLNWVHAWIAGVSVDSIQASITQFLNNHTGNKIGEIVRIDEAQKLHIDAFIARILLNLANSKIADALKTIDIRSIVTERINSLDMEEVERIVLDVMASQFRWINLFGAILGALIGAVQVLFSFYLKGI